MLPPRRTTSPGLAFAASQWRPARIGLARPDEIKSCSLPQASDSKIRPMSKNRARWKPWLIAALGLLLITTMAGLPHRPDRGDRDRLNGGGRGAEASSVLRVDVTIPAAHADTPVGSARQEDHSDASSRPRPGASGPPRPRRAASGRGSHQGDEHSRCETEHRHDQNAARVMIEETEDCAGHAEQMGRPGRHHRACGDPPREPRRISTGAPPSPERPLVAQGDDVGAALDRAARMDRGSRARSSLTPSPGLAPAPSPGRHGRADPG